MLYREFVAMVTEKAKLSEEHEFIIPLLFSVKAYNTYIDPIYMQKNLSKPEFMEWFFKDYSVMVLIKMTKNDLGL